MKLTVKSSPHIKGNFSTRRLMLDVVIALIPALAVGAAVLGVRALLVAAVSVATALAAYHKNGIIPCTACRYCLPCPVGVNIPKNFTIYNNMKISGNKRRAANAYKGMPPKQQAANCVSCNKCKKRCPQQIDIPTLLKQIAQELK